MASKTRARSRRRRASQTVRRRRASQTVRRRRASQPAPRRASFPRQPRRPPPRPLYRATPDLLAHGRDLYENSGETIPAIAAVMGCSRSTVYRVARSERWLRYAAPAHDLPRALKLALEAEKLGQQSQPSPRHPEVAAEGGPRRMNGPVQQDLGRRPSRLATLAPQGDGESQPASQDDGNTEAAPADLPAGLPTPPTPSCACIAPRSRSCPRSRPCARSSSASRTARSTPSAPRAR